MLGGEAAAKAGFTMDEASQRCVVCVCERESLCVCVRVRVRVRVRVCRFGSSCMSCD